MEAEKAAFFNTGELYVFFISGASCVGDQRLYDLGKGESIRRRIAARGSRRTAQAAPRTAPGSHPRLDLQRRETHVSS
jgi:hypothetical protein